MTMAREPRATKIGTTESRILENVVNQVPDGPTTFDSSTCAAGEQETPRFDVESLIFLNDSRMFRFQHSEMKFFVRALAKKNHECGNQRCFVCISSSLS